MIQNYTPAVPSQFTSVEITVLDHCLLPPLSPILVWSVGTSQYSPVAVMYMCAVSSTGCVTFPIHTGYRMHVHGLQGGDIIFFLWLLLLHEMRHGWHEITHLQFPVTTPHHFTQHNTKPHHTIPNNFHSWAGIELGHNPSPSPRKGQSLNGNISSLVMARVK